MIGWSRSRRVATARCLAGGRKVIPMNKYLGIIRTTEKVEEPIPPLASAAVTPRPVTMAETLYPPRGMSRIESAAYIGISPSLFDEMVKDGRMPGPKLINSRTVWDRIALDRAFEQLPNRDQAPDEEWRVAV